MVSPAIPDPSSLFRCRFNHISIISLLIQRTKSEMSNSRWINAYLLVLANGLCSPLWLPVFSFQCSATLRTCRNLELQKQKQFGLFSTANGSDDSLRRMLEASWNTSKMGRVPANPIAAAKEAYSSIIQAAGGTQSADDDTIEEHENMAGIFFVDLLLPSYDISQVVEGVNLYDEVSAVEYCIALANCFKGKTEILVRDKNVVETVDKVLKVREERKNEQEQAGVSDGDVMFGGGGLIDDEKEIIGDTSNEIGSVSEQDEFRQRLVANWNSEAPSEDGIDTSSKIKDVVQNPANRSESYRLASLFGATKINTGPDMATSVIQAVRNNALPTNDEDNIIILSAVGKDEMVAVRGLVAKYGSHKKIILVNCQFQPVPRELITAETVYSVLPLAGKKTTNYNKENDDNEKPTPKIVVLRRYPRDWEVFVDVGIGYELAETIAANGSNRRGLGMESIARAVERHLDFVSRR